jgi:hypothetical protein
MPSPAATPSPSPRPWRLLLAVGGLLVVGAWLQIGMLHRSHIWGDDHALYLLQAISLLQGTTAELAASNGAAMAECTVQVGPPVYPWGLPLLLAPLVRAVGLDLLWLKTPNVIAWLLTMLATVGLCWRRLPAPWLLALVAILATAPNLLFAANHILSDLPFLALSTLALALIGHLVVDRGRLLGRWADGVLLGLLLAAAVAVRPHGILLAATLVGLWGVAWLARRRGWTEAPALSWPLLGVPLAVLVVGIVALHLALPSGEGAHAGYLARHSWAKLYDHLRYYAALPAEFFLPLALGPVIHGLCLAAVAVGVCQQPWRDRHLLLYGALVLLANFAWPDIAGLRYLYPLVPLYFYFALRGAEATGRLFGPAGARRWQMWLLALLALLVAAMTTVSVQTVRKNLAAGRVREQGPDLPTAQALFAYIRAELPAEARLAFYKPRAMRLYTGRLAYAIAEPSRLDRATHLCLYLRSDAYDQVPPALLDAWVAEGRLVVLYANPDFRLYAWAKP